MTSLKINPLLSVLHSDTGVQLHLTDAYGHSNACIPLTQGEALLLALELYPELDEDPGDDLAEVDDDEEEEEEVPADGGEVPPPAPSSGYWSSLTKAEIVDEVQRRFGVSLDHNNLKADLVAQAEALEAQA